MAKGNFSDTVEDILKSIGVKKSADEKKKPEDEEIEKEELFEFDDSEGSDDEEDDLEKGCGSNVKKGCGVKKSFDENEDYLDATELVKSMGAEIDALRAENEDLKKSMEETQNSVLEIAKALGEPVARQSVVAKSIGNGDAAPTPSNAKPTSADFDTFKNAICKSARDGRMEPEKVQFLNSEFQKAMAGGVKSVSPKVWAEICSIVRESK